jgi:hypothetical protein
MIRNWISSNTTHKGLTQAITEMSKGQSGKPEPAQGPSRGDIAKLTNRLAGGAIQRSTRRR